MQPVNPMIYHQAPHVMRQHWWRFVDRLLAGLLCLLVGLASPTQAATLAICISDQAFPPFTFVDHEGDSQRLIRLAVEHQGWQVEFVALPWRRCLAGVASGAFSGVAGASATQEYLAFMDFPQRSGQPDQRRALGMTRLLVYRAAGSVAGWDGRSFSGLARPVLYLAGREALKARLTSMGVRADDTAKTSPQLASMLLKGRGSLVIDHDYQVAELIASPQFQGRFEVLPVPFGEAPIFLAFGRHLHERQHRLVEAIWDEIGVLRGDEVVSRIPD